MSVGQLPLRKTCIAPCIRSLMTERTFLVISSQFIQELERVFAAQGTKLHIEDLPYPYTEAEGFERMEKAWRQLVALVGMKYEEAMEMTPVLEKAVTLLQERSRA